MEHDPDRGADGAASAEWIEAAEACEAWVLDQRLNHNRDWWLENRVPSEADYEKSDHR